MALPAPFLVLATQNPVESESTFQLPAAQMDRFLVRLSLGYPAAEEETQMLRSLGDSIPFDTVRTVTGAVELTALQRQAAEVYVTAQLERSFRTLDYYKSILPQEEPTYD